MMNQYKQEQESHKTEKKKRGQQEAKEENKDDGTPQLLSSSTPHLSGEKHCTARHSTRDMYLSAEGVYEGSD